MPFGRQGRPGLLSGIPRTVVISGTAQMTMTAVSHRVQDRAARPTAVPGSLRASGPVPHPAGGDQLADQLGRLAELHAAGVLTSDEFAAAKSRLLN